MKWRHWAILIVLVLLNYIVFSTAFTRMAAQRHPPYATRTPMPTFTIVTAGPVSWVVVPTSTPVSTQWPSPPTPMPSADISSSPTEAAPTPQPAGTSTSEAPAAVASNTPATSAAATATSAPTLTAAPTLTSATYNVVHTVQRGEYVALIARQYGVSVEAIVQANALKDPSHIEPGQKLVIPLSGEPPTPAATRRPEDTAAPGANPTSPPPTATRKPPTATPVRPTATRKPPTATPAPPTATNPPPAAFQFTGQVVWDPQVAPNCAGPAISRHSVVKDGAGNPVNGVRIAVDCYGNVWQSHPSGNPGEYDAGHYDFAFGQSSPQPWTCTAYVYDVNGQPVTSSQVVTISFDTNDCQPHGSGHQVAIVNWVKHW